MIRTYKRKLILTENQSNRIDSWIGSCRLVYNLSLEIRKEAYRKSGKSVSKYNLGSQLKHIRSDYTWMSDVPFDSMYKAIDRLDNAYKKFFSTHMSGGGFPKFASKKKYQSIDFRDVCLRDGKVKVPNIGLLKIFKDAAMVGNPISATIKREPTGYFINITCKDVPPRFISENQAIGIDMGITKFCTDSNGLMIENPRHFKKYERKLRIENRSLSRKKKGSNSYSKQCKKLGLLHHKIANVRKDFLHKESTKIAKANSVVYMEDLKVSNMVKSNLAKSISDVGWSNFRIMLSYKTNVISINPAYTSQTCFECKSIDKKSRISQSEYVCTNCGHVSNADINAAKNIKEKGILLERQREALACA